MESPLYFELPAFLLGLLFGSFLNVCISRLPYHESVVKPGSRCPRCTAPIAWYDNIPLLSWVLLVAKCRSCRARIPWRYPLVELGVGVWFALASVRGDWRFNQLHCWGAPFGPQDVAQIVTAIGFAILGFLLIGLLVMDWQTHTLPDVFTLTGTAIGFVLVCVQSMLLAPHEYDLLLHGRNPLSSPGSVVDTGNVILTGPEHMVLGRLLAITLAAGIILAVRALYKAVRGHEGMGLGDAKLMAMLAAFLGFGPAMLALFVGVVLSSFYAVTLLIRRRGTATTALPFGTFLCVGGLLSALLGEPLIRWYTSLF